MVTNLDLETGKIEGATWDTGYASIEDFLDDFYQKYVRLSKKDKRFLCTGNISVDWSYFGGDIMVKSLRVKYGGNSDELISMNQTIKNMVFCGAMKFIKILGETEILQL